MVDPVFVILASIALAVVSAGFGLSVDVPYVEYGLPMLVLLLGSGVYTLQTKGVSGVAEDLATSIFVGVVSSFLMFLVMQGEQRRT